MMTRRRMLLGTTSLVALPFVAPDGYVRCSEFMIELMAAYVPMPMRWTSLKWIR